MSSQTHFILRRSLARLWGLPLREDFLAATLAPLLPHQGRILDIGCRDGQLAARVKARRPDVDIRGIDTACPNTGVAPCTEFDGSRIPEPTAAFDAALLVDVLHHAADPLALLRETGRVAPRCVIIKDHVVTRGSLDRFLLLLIDLVGNLPAGVRVRGTYWTRAEWQNLLTHADLTLSSWQWIQRPYPGVPRWIFGRSLHCLITAESRNLRR